MNNPFFERDVLTLLGIDPKRQITKLTLTVEIGHFPVVELTEIVIESAEIETIERRYRIEELIDRDPDVLL